MITRELLKEEIDKIEDQYLDALYKIITAIKPSHPTITEMTVTEWHKFIDETYGSLASDPIQRWPQGEYEIRESIE